MTTPAPVLIRRARLRGAARAVALPATLLVLVLPLGLPPVGSTLDVAEGAVPIAVALGAVVMYLARSVSAFVDDHTTYRADVDAIHAVDDGRAFLCPDNRGRSSWRIDGHRVPARCDLTAALDLLWESDAVTFGPDHGVPRVALPGPRWVAPLGPGGALAARLRAEGPR